MASKNNNPKARETELVVQELKGELLIYDLDTNKAYCLNPTAAIIWNLCDGNSSVSEITKQLSKKLKQPVTDDLVWLALDQFKTDNLLSENEKVEIKFNGLSRREAVRKAGLASIVALPVIASLLAPTAAMARSGGGGGGCVNSGGAPAGTTVNSTGGAADCTACEQDLEKQCCSNTIDSGITFCGGSSGSIICVSQCD